MYPNLTKMKFIVILIVSLFFAVEAQHLLIERFKSSYDFKFNAMQKYDNVLISICESNCVAVSQNKTANVTFSQVELVNNCGCSYDFIPSMQTAFIYGNIYFMLEKNNKTTTGVKMFSITDDMYTSKKRSSFAYIDNIANIYIN